MRVPRRMTLATFAHLADGRRGLWTATAMVVVVVVVVDSLSVSASGLDRMYYQYTHSNESRRRLRFVGCAPKVAPNTKLLFNYLCHLHSLVGIARDDLDMPRQSDGVTHTHTHTHKEKVGGTRGPAGFFV